MCDFPNRTEDVKVHQAKLTVHVAAGCDIFDYVKATDGCLRAVLKLPPGTCFALSHSVQFAFCTCPSPPSVHLSIKPPFPSELHQKKSPNTCWMKHAVRQSTTALAPDPEPKPKCFWHVWIEGQHNVWRKCQTMG
ncbi:hypothetical protein QQF64_001634 [Cirrhinus molitorella]|uniref:Uncharacterized protein n=1 Tax=Cirrhinus molitorella TaxID=172907 RepID=A0ABR3P1Y9_9TELE